MPTWWRNAGTRIKALYRQYGLTFFAVLFTLWGIEWGLWVLLLKSGVPVDALLARLGLEADAGGQWLGLVAVGLAATQATKPTRIVVSAALTPAVARWMPHGHAQTQ